MTIGLQFTESDGYLKLSSLKDIRDNTYVNNATVTVTLYDKDDAELSGETWPVSLAYIAASNGNYYAVLEDTIFTAEQNVKAKIIIVGNSVTRTIWFPVAVRKDTNQIVLQSDLKEDMETDGIL